MNKAVIFLGLVVWLRIPKSIALPHRQKYDPAKGIRVSETTGSFSIKFSGGAGIFSDSMEDTESKSSINFSDDSIVKIIGTGEKDFGSSAIFSRDPGFVVKCNNGLCTLDGDTDSGSAESFSSGSGVTIIDNGDTDSESVALSCSNGMCISMEDTESKSAINFSDDSIVKIIGSGVKDSGSSAIFSRDPDFVVKCNNGLCMHDGGTDSGSAESSNEDSIVTIIGMGKNYSENSTIFSIGPGVVVKCNNGLCIHAEDTDSGSTESFSGVYGVSTISTEDTSNENTASFSVGSGITMIGTGYADSGNAAIDDKSKNMLALLFKNINNKLKRQESFSQT